MQSERVKRKEYIKTQDQYVGIIRNSRNPLFITVDKSDIVFLNLETKLKNEKISKQSLKINSAFVINYRVSKEVHVQRNYNGKAKSYVIQPSCTFNDFKVLKAHFLKAYSKNLGSKRILVKTNKSLTNNDGKKLYFV